MAALPARGRPARPWGVPPYPGSSALSTSFPSSWVFASAVASPVASAVASAFASVVTAAVVDATFSAEANSAVSGREFAIARAESAPAPADTLPWPALPPLLLPPGDGTGAPDALALDALGRLFVLDRARGRIYRSSPAGDWMEFGPGEQGGERWPQIARLAARPGPDLLALDAAAGLIYRFDLDGRLRATIAWRAGHEVGSFPPADFGLTPTGELLLLDRDAGRLLLFDRTGRLVTDLAAGLAGPRRPRAPSQLGLDGEGRIYLLDPAGARILRFSRQGGALDLWEYGEGLGPDGAQALLAVRPGGSVVLVSRWGNWARIYGPNGELRHDWRRRRALRFPLTGAAAADTVLYLACPGEGQVLRWRLPDSDHGGRHLGP